MPALSNQTLKGYQIHEQIGAGGFGAVYKAYQPIIEREVAIKVILAEFANQPEFIRRFEAEAQLIARLEHSNIVPLYDYWRDPDGAYLVLRWLRGGSLTSALEANPYSPNEAARLLDQIAAALTIAHRNNVVHRDIKPDNILLDEDNNAYLTDFGISTIVGHTPDDGEGVSGTIRYIAPEQLREEPDAIAIDIYSLGIVMFEVLTGQHPFEEHTNAEIVMKHLTDTLPDLHTVRPDLPQALSDVIHKATEKEPADRYQSTQEMAIAFRQAISSTSTVDVDLLGDWQIDTSALVNPFKGLRAFQEADVSDFFGRQTLVNDLLETLSTNRFVTVIGPSGSGKSSVVRAGLIPALRNGAIDGSADWFVADMVPGANPFEELATALLGVTASPAIPLMQLFRSNSNGISEAIKLSLPSPDSQLVLVIDQFEEVFTLIEDEDERAQFLSGLLNAVNDSESCIRLVITMRADFYDRPLLYPEFGELVRSHMQTVLPLTRNQLEEVISYPILQSGAMMEPGLVDLIIQDVKEQPGVLPLLQYALTELFDRHEDGTLTTLAYNDIGGVVGALAKRAEEVYLSLDTQHQAIARQLFLRLVTLNDSGHDTRRRVSREELAAFDIQQLNTVLDAFGQARLLTFDRDPTTRTPTVEVSHEALIYRWATLTGWIETSREDIRLHRRLMNEINEWLSSGQDAGFLVTDARLEQYEAWSGTTDILLNDNEQLYLSQSLARRDEERQRDEARKAREIELQQNAYRRLQYLVASMAVFLLVAVGLSLFALNQRDVAETARSTSDANAIVAEEARELAERRADESESLALASQASLELRQYNTDLALALALAANQIDDPPALSQTTLMEVAYAPATTHRCELDTVEVAATAFSPNGSQIITSAWDQVQPTTTLTLWDIETCTMLEQTIMDDAIVTAIAFLSDGTRAVYTTLNTVNQSSAFIGVWDVENWQSIDEQSAGFGYVLNLSVSDDDQSVLVDNVQTGATVWTLDPLAQHEGRAQPYYLSNFLSDNIRALSANQRTAVLWDTNTGEEITRYDTPPDIPLASLTVSPDEQYVLGSTSFAVLVLWDLQSGDIVREFRGHGEEVIDIVFLPDGKHFLSASVDTSVRLWDIETGAEVYRFDGHTDATRDIQMLDNRRQFVSWSKDNTVRIWNLYNANQRERYEGHNAGVNGVAFSSDGRYIASGDIEAGLILWDRETTDIIHTFADVQFVHRIRFSSDGSRMLTSALNGLFMHDTETYDLIWHNPFAIFTDARFNADDSVIVGTSFTNASGGLWIINAEDGNLIKSTNNSTAVFSGDFVDKESIVFGAGDTACIWNFVADEVGQCFEEHTAEVASVRVSADGSQLVTASYDGTAKLWEIESGEVLLSMEGHSAPVQSAEFSVDRQHIITASADASFRVWDASSGAEIHRINWTAPVWSATFIEGSDVALVGSEDGLVSLWDVTTPDMDTLVNWIQDNRYVVELTCDQLSEIAIQEDC